MTKPQPLTEEALSEIEARAKKYKGLADRAATPADTEVIRWLAKQVAALIQTARALRMENERLSKHAADLEHDLNAAIKECNERHAN